MKETIKGAISLYHRNMIFRADIGLYFSLAINIGYAVFEAISGYVLKSAWMGTLAFYYIVLSSMRFFILRRKKQTDIRKQWEAYRICGIIMLLLTIALAGLHILNINQYHTIEYPGYVIYAVALISVYNLQSSMIAAFGGNDEVFRVTMSNCVGVGVVAIIVSISVHMIAKANRKH